MFYVDGYNSFKWTLVQACNSHTVWHLRVSGRFLELSFEVNTGRQITSVLLGGAGPGGGVSLGNDTSTGLLIRWIALSSVVVWVSTGLTEAVGLFLQSAISLPRSTLLQKESSSSSKPPALLWFWLKSSMFEWGVSNRGLRLEISKVGYLHHLQDFRKKNPRHNKVTTNGSSVCVSVYLLLFCLHVMSSVATVTLKKSSG